MPASRIQGVLFDLGDTLLDFGPVDTFDLFEQGARLTYAYLGELGVETPAFSAFHRQQLRALRRAYLWSHIIRREFNAKDVIRKLVATMGHNLTDPQLDQVAWCWYEPLSRKARVEAGLAEMLAEFVEAGLTLGIVSNTFIPASALDRHLEQLGLLKYLPIRIYSCDVRYRKPDRRIFRIALKTAGLDAERVIFVGDTPKADIRGARREGLISVLKDPTGRHVNSRIRPDHTIRSITELSQILAHYG